MVSVWVLMGQCSACLVARTWEKTWLEWKTAVDLCQVAMQELSDWFASGRAPDFHLSCLARYSVQTLPEPAPDWQPTTTAEKPCSSTKSWPYSTPQSTGCELHTAHPDLIDDSMLLFVSLCLWNSAIWRLARFHGIKACHEALQTVFQSARFE